MTVVEPFQFYLAPRHSLRPKRCPSRFDIREDFTIVFQMTKSEYSRDRWGGRTEHKSLGRPQVGIEFQFWQPEIQWTRSGI